MSLQPATTVTTQRRPGAKLVVAAAARMRRLPSSRHLARRHIAITLTKFLLPALALALLASIALWPEFDRAKQQAMLALRHVGSEIEGAQLIDARYHGTDERGRPYTLTAATAQRAGPERVNLTIPKGDITLQDGTWLMVKSKQGVFMQHSNLLDLSHDVTLYRDDGTTLVTASASMDLKNGAAAGSEPVHAEGPFGTLDAQGGFTLLDKGSSIQFAGPAHLLLNGSNASGSPATSPATPSGAATAAAPPTAALATTATADPSVAPAGMPSVAKPPELQAGTSAGTSRATSSGAQAGASALATRSGGEQSGGAESGAVRSGTARAGVARRSGVARSSGSVRSEAALPGADHSGVTQ
jgi:lipopolysaccharide export system protein LptC